MKGDTWQFMLLLHEMSTGEKWVIHKYTVFEGFTVWYVITHCFTYYLYERKIYFIKEESSAWMPSFLLRNPLVLLCIQFFRPLSWLWVIWEWEWHWESSVRTHCHIWQIFGRDCNMLCFLNCPSKKCSGHFCSIRGKACYQISTFVWIDYLW